jgi:hypothetical protein
MNLLAYIPLIDFINVGGYWPVLLIPLAIAIAVVYKALKVRNIRELPRAAAGVTLTILVGMVLAAGLLVLIVWVAERL